MSGVSAWRLLWMALAVPLAVVVSGCGRRTASPQPVQPVRRAPKAAPQLSPAELGMALFPEATVKEIRRSKPAPNTPAEIAVVLETSRAANDVATFYRKELGQGKYRENVVEEDNGRIIALWSEAGGMRREVTIAEDFETGKTKIDLFRGMPQPTDSGAKGKR
jgi:F0F1-type ATP synthase membrane subunit c/vacuolar-type H+-ATPase subunit K